MNVVEYIRSKAEKGAPEFDIDWETEREIAHDMAMGQFQIAQNNIIEQEYKKKKPRATGKSSLPRGSDPGNTEGVSNGQAVSVVRQSLEAPQIVSQVPANVKPVYDSLVDIIRSLEDGRKVLSLPNPVSESNFINALFKAGIDQHTQTVNGIKVLSTKKAGNSSGYKIANGRTTRVSTHPADATYFIQNGTDNNISFVIRKPTITKQFISDNKANVIEIVYDRNSLKNNPENMAHIVHDIARFVATGQFNDTLGAIRYHYSGSKDFITDAMKSLIVDAQMREDAKTINEIHKDAKRLDINLENKKANSVGWEERDRAYEKLAYSQTQDKSSDAKFMVSTKEVSDWNDTVDNFVAGKMKPRTDATVLPRTPVVIGRLLKDKIGIDPEGKSIIVSNEVMKKAMVGKHAISQTEMKKLVTSIDAPLAVFISRTRPDDSITALIPIRDANGGISSIVPLDYTGKNASGQDAIRITSIYGRLSQDSVQSWINQGYILYADRKNISRSFPHGLQLPGRTKTAKRFLDETDFEGERLGIVSNSPDAVNADASAKMSVGDAPRINGRNFIAGRAMVAEDYGRGEQTPSALAASLELDNNHAAPISMTGQIRKMSLPLSELEHLSFLPTWACTTSDGPPSSLSAKSAVSTVDP